MSLPPIIRFRVDPDKLGDFLFTTCTLNYVTIRALQELLLKLYAEVAVKKPEDVGKLYTEKLQESLLEFYGSVQKYCDFDFEGKPISPDSPEEPPAQ